MLRSFRSIRGYAILAVDGEIGSVKDVFIDDQAWQVRYLVADAGGWLAGRRVLIAPAALGVADWETRTLNVSLTREQVRNSPPVTSDLPVNRQMEQQIASYFDWPAYWAPHAPGAGPNFVAAVPPDAALERASTEPPPEEQREGDPHLRSVKEIIGYHVETVDGSMGHIEDFVLDEDPWIVRYVVVDTVNWWPGKKVILAPDWIVGVSWDTRKVRFDLTKDALKDAPSYDPSKPVNREYETMLYDFHGRPKYWVKT